MQTAGLSCDDSGCLQSIKDEEEGSC